MKIYYYLIISFGIMLTLALAGIDGIGTNLTSLIKSNDTVIQPPSQYNGSIGDDPTGVINDIKGSGTNLWTKILIAILAIAVLGGITGVQVLGSGVSLDVSRMIFGGIAYVLFGLIVSDMWSIVTLVFSFGVDWISWFMAIIISVYLIGFAVSILEFTRGSD